MNLIRKDMGYCIFLMGRTLWAILVKILYTEKVNIQHIMDNKLMVYGRKINKLNDLKSASNMYYLFIKKNYFFYFYFKF